MKEQFLKYGIELTEKQISQFEKLLEVFKQKNSELNLSAIRDDEGIVEKHFVDSLLPTEFFDFSGKIILDLGAGGGFPTLPLSIFTGSKIVSLDSIQKKMKAVHEMSVEIGTNVHPLIGRAEDFGQKEIYREQFFWVIARAVAPWPLLLELALPFVEVGGSFIAYQGPQILEDLKTYKGLEAKLGGKVVQVLKKQLGDAERIFVEVEKVRKCPKEYPRRAGTPQKKPLQITDNNSK